MMASTRILQLTDFHFLAEPGQTLLGVDTELSFAETLAAALGSGLAPDLVLLTGDLVQDPVAAAYRRLRQHLTALRCPIYCLPGNHDEQGFIIEHLVGGRISCAGRVLVPGWQIICLDSTVAGNPRGRLGTAQLERLEMQLAEHEDRYALIALHHHPLPTGSPWLDSMVVEDRDRFFDLVCGWPRVKVVLFGHIHQLMDREYRGLRVLGTPSTCFQFQPNQVEFTLDPIPPGWRWLTLAPDGQIDTEVGRLGGIPEGLEVGSRGYT